MACNLAPSGQLALVVILHLLLPSAVACQRNHKTRRRATRRWASSPRDKCSLSQTSLWQTGLQCVTVLSTLFWRSSCHFVWRIRDVNF